MSTTEDFGQRPGNAPVKTDRDGTRISAGGSAKDDRITLLVPSHEMTHHTKIHVAQLAWLTAVRIHNPNLGSSGLIRVISDQFAIRRIKWIYVYGICLCQPVKLRGLEINAQDIRRT